jgi:hypothetical protein
MQQPSNNYPGLFPIAKDTYAHWGVGTFTTTGTTVEIQTQLDVVESAFATPTSYTGSAASGGHVMFCDRTVSSGAVTFARKASVDSGATFSYLMIGKKWTAPS